MFQDPYSPHRAMVCRLKTSSELGSRLISITFLPSAKKVQLQQGCRTPQSSVCFIRPLPVQHPAPRKHLPNTGLPTCAFASLTSLQSAKRELRL